MNEGCEMKIYIVWGFLGSGKTTFINYLLSSFLAESKVVIIENESGKESVDGALLRSRKYVVKEMKAGCVCCSLRCELPIAIKDIYETLHPDILLLEPSGIASLEELSKMPNLKIDAIFTLLDVTNYYLLMKINSPFYRRQFSLSSIILLTKTDIAEKGIVRQISEEVLSIAPLAFITDDYRKVAASRWNKLLTYQAKRYFPLYPCADTPSYFKDTLTVDQILTEPQLGKILHEFISESDSVLRAKGLFKMAFSNRVIKIDYVCGQWSREEMDENLEIDCSFFSFWSTQPINVHKFREIIIKYTE